MKKLLFILACSTITAFSQDVGDYRWSRISPSGPPSTAYVQWEGRNIIYVSKGNGATDTRTGLSKYDSTRPFATITTAQVASEAGDTIVILPGDFSDEIGSPEDGVIIYAYPGAIVDPTFGASVYVKSEIGATSGLDSSTMVRSGSNPIIPRNTGTLNATSSRDPCLLPYISSGPRQGWWCFYNTQDVSGNYHGAVAHTTDPEGLTGWTPANTNLTWTGTAGSWNAAVECTSGAYYDQENDILYVYTVGNQNSADYSNQLTNRVGLRTVAAGLDWSDPSNYVSQTVAAPLFGQTQSWETGAGLFAPSLTKFGNQYYLFYTAHVPATTAWETGLAIASSPAGPFTKVTNNPILKPSSVSVPSLYNPVEEVTVGILDNGTFFSTSDALTFFSGYYGFATQFSTQADGQSGWASFNCLVNISTASTWEGGRIGTPSWQKRPNGDILVLYHGISAADVALGNENYQIGAATFDYPASISNFGMQPRSNVNITGGEISGILSFSSSVAAIGTSGGLRYGRTLYVGRPQTAFTITASPTRMSLDSTVGSGTAGTNTKLFIFDGSAGGSGLGAGVGVMEVNLTDQDLGTYSTSGGVTTPLVRLKASTGDHALLKSGAAYRFSSTTGVGVFSGSGSPEAVVSAPVGSIYLNATGSSGTSLYMKSSGSGNTGWDPVTP